MIKQVIFILLVFFNSFMLSQHKIEFPIAAFHGVPPGQYSTKEQFETMRKAGINIGYTLFNNNTEALKALDAAQAGGVKLIIRVESLFSDTRETVELFKNHPALYGYCLWDEPAINQFNDLAKKAKEIKQYDPKHIIYINLFPNYVPKDALNGYTYRDYLTKFLQTVPVQFLSFDHYPLVDNKIRGEWYENLETVKDVTREMNINFWAFANSTIHYNYLKPTLEGIKLQQFGNLLYGAQGIQYFTYWTLTYEYNWIKEKYGYSIVDDRGNPTPTYDIVKKVNEQVQRLAWVFSGAKSDAVFHTGREIPMGTKKLTSIPQPFKTFSTQNKNALVSLMSKGKKKFIIIQNKSLTDHLNFQYQLTKAIYKVNNISGNSVPVNSFKKNNDIILPGDILIFAYDK